MIGKVGDLDVAIRASGDSPERIAEWPAIRHLLRERYSGRLSETDLWGRCKDQLAAEGIPANTFLAWRLEYFIEWLRGQRDSGLPTQPEPKETPSRYRFPFHESPAPLSEAQKRAWDAATQAEQAAERGFDAELERIGNIPVPAKSEVIDGRKKRSTARGEARAKLIAGLTEHHQYSRGSCLNQSPIGVNEIASAVKVSPSTASRFFDKEFNGGEKGGHRKYQFVCRDQSLLLAALKLLNQEYSPHHFIRGTPSRQPEE